MNSHIAERFSHDRYPDPERVPLSAPLRTNNDIIEYFDNAKKTITRAGTWHSKSEIPLPSEILTPSAPGFDFVEKIIDLDDELRPNKVEGAYEDKEDYLRTHYELLREDAVRPLREAVAEVRKDPWRDELDYPPNANIGIYEPTYITSVVFSSRGLAVRVAFSLNRVKKFVRWKQSKRLITGSLVALSPAEDAFRTECILATVAARPLSGLEVANPPELDLFFARPQDFQIDPMRKWVMVECRSSLYEASRHTLLALQHMMHEPFPLSDHVVKAKKEVNPPPYVRDNPYTDMSPLVSMEEADQFQNVNILQEWLAGNSHSLDKSQSRALERILTKSLAIIQGPPGTGKTHVSVIALKILLANLRRDDPPIIVTCQTNHALDQLLRHVAEFEPNFIRLGGRSKDKDKIKKRTLFEVRMSISQEKLPRSRKSQSMAQLRQRTEKMRRLLAPLEMGKGCLDHRLLVKMGLLTESQADSLEMDAENAMGIAQDAPGIQMEQWLGKSLVQCRRPIQPDDFGMAYEQEGFDEVEQIEELEAEAVAHDDDDIEALKGPVTSLSDNQTGRLGNSSLRTDDDVRAVLKRTTDLTGIAAADRGVIYRYLQRMTKELILKEFRQLAALYEHVVVQRKVGQWEQDQRLLAKQRLIGMTTTGLSKYRGLIASLRPRVVLVEEAAETLEAPVTAACVPSLEHLILVGDHQQLRPHTQIHALEDEPYYFNMSLFERMVINNIDMDCLTRQRRMVPEIRRLLAPIYGNTLKDHVSVMDTNNRPPVEGMGGCNSFFFTHEWSESRDHNMSAFNDREAEMIVGLFNYLVLNGVESQKITILTFYNGQRTVLLNKLRNHQNLRGNVFNVVTVDSYQGEENDVVLLSLVRSNRKHNIGFLSVDNRVCVALSRAKRGFYLFGNAEMLACESNTWEHVVKILWGKDKKKNEVLGCRIGYQFPLQCSLHGRKTWIKQPDDWELVNGGCDKPCRCSLPCGHRCMLNCHPFENDRINCTQKCNRYIPTCGHACGAMCCDPCKCMICDRRNNGMKTMLKPPQKNGASSSVFKARLLEPLLDMGASSNVFMPLPQEPLLDLFQAPQTLMRPAATSMATEHSGSTPTKWKAYVNGGAKADDARILQKAREAEAEFLERLQKAERPAAASRSDMLIELSPEKKTTEPMSSRNTDLLLDFGEDAPPAWEHSTIGPSKERPS
ncbi:P-loop containing nucleoside triphosphate hydrolase protein, partial [Lentithecium fluviatile CBS 122367]